MERQYLITVTVPAVLNASTVEDKNEALCGGVYQAFSSMCGTFDTQYKPRRVRKHARHLKRLTAQKNEARKRFRQAKKSTASESNIGLLAQEFYRLVRLHSAEKRLHLKSRCRLEALKARRECNKSFWKFAEKLFDAECVGVEPQFGAKQAEEYFRKVYSADPCSFTQPEWLPSSPPLSVDFNTDPISVEEISLVIKRAKSKSASSPLDRVSYHILKRCPSLLPALCDLYNACWSSGSVPPAWKQAVIHLIPKSSAATSPSDLCNFRPITITSCVGKIFTSILRSRWLSFMISNGYMNTDVQKAFVKGIPGCSEHYCKLATIIKDSREKHRSLSVCWLDLANAYGSVPHGLIQFALQHYNSPPQFMNTVSGLYSGLSATITTTGWATTSVPLQIGVYQGDPLSVVIFNTVMCTLIDALGPLKHLGYNISGTRHTVNLLPYADDTCLVQLAARGYSIKWRSGCSGAA